MRMRNDSQHCVFEYLYRDASNWKVWGKVILQGVPTKEETTALCDCFDSGEFFIAEQLCIPTLFQEFMVRFGVPTKDDHCWHEFAGIRPATEVEVKEGPIWGTMRSLLRRANSIVTWNCNLAERRNQLSAS